MGLKKVLNKLLCSHSLMDLARWHLVHFPDYEPLSVEIEWKCEKCGKTKYEYLHGENMNSWINKMGNHKRA